MEHCKDFLHHGWVIRPTYGIKYAIFCYFGCIYMWHKQCTLTKAFSWVSMVDWLLAMEEVRKQCNNNVVHGLIEEFGLKSPL